MSWKITVFGIAVMITACAGQVTKTNILTISPKTITVPLRGEVPALVVCYELKDGIDTSAIKTTSFTIGKNDGNGQLINSVYETIGVPPADTNCKFFELGLTDYMDGDVEFILEAHGLLGLPIKDADAEATFKLPSTLLESSVISNSQIVKPTTSQTAEDSLRLFLSEKIDATLWQVCLSDKTQVQLTCDVTGTTCYAIEVGSKAESLCIKATTIVSSPAVFIAAELTGATTVNTQAAVDEVVLIYGYDDGSRALIPSKLNIKSTTSITDSIEIVAYKDKDNVYKICKGSDQATGQDCVLDTLTYEKGDNDMSIIIMNIVDSSNEATMSDIIPFKDYNIKVTSLGTTVIELYWKRGDAHTFYGATLDIGSINAAIDCSSTNPVPADPTYCYSYFVGLSNQDYQITVEPATGTVVTALTPIMTNQIKTEPINPTEKKQIMGITLVQEAIYDDGLLQVCYKDSESNNTRHEAIMIDEDGHWMKMYQSTQREDLMYCFSPVDLLTSALSITKDTKLTAIVVERELAGYQVLASGQVDIDLSALRMIQPDVNNNSEGSMSTLAIVGAAIGGVACLMALVAAAILVVMKRKKSNDGLQYPLQRSNVEDSNNMYSLDNPNSTN